MLPQSDTDKLESLIDSHGLAAVLDAMAQIAFEKAEHIVSNYADTATARQWDKANAALRKAESKARELGLAL